MQISSSKPKNNNIVTSSQTHIIAQVVPCHAITLFVNWDKWIKLITLELVRWNLKHWKFTHKINKIEISFEKQW